MGLSSTVTAGVAALAALLPGFVTADKPYHTDLEIYQKGDKFGKKPVQHFHSSNIVAPLYQVNKFDTRKIDTENGYMFMCGRYGDWGPSIVSSKDLSLVYADQNYGGLAQTARSWENWKGQRVMSVYTGGAVRIYDENYEQIYVVRPHGDLEGVFPDTHEAMLTHDDTVLLVACPAKEVDLRPVGGPQKGKKVGNCHIQEIDPDTNQVLFQFATLDYFKVEDSMWDYKNQDNWDFCHMNAVEKTLDGNYLISYRHLSTVIMVSGETGKVMWAMGGKKNMFKDITEDGNAKFNYQHEARMSGNNTFTLFDNHRLANGYCKEGECSRGLEVEFDAEKKTVKMINEWYHPQKLISASRGGVQRTSTGNVIVAWGQNPMYTEYTADGELVMDIQRGQVLSLPHGIFDVITYRIWKGKWVGNPSWGPNISYTKENGDEYVHVSWNGATEVDTWALLHSDNKDDLDGGDKVLSESPRTGFETPFRIETIKKFARVAAVNHKGEIIGATPVVDTTTGKLIKVKYDITDVSTDGDLHVDNGDGDDDDDDDDNSGYDNSYLDDSDDGAPVEDDGNDGDHDNDHDNGSGTDDSGDDNTDHDGDNVASPSTAVAAPVPSGTGDADADADHAGDGHDSDDSKDKDKGDEQDDSHSHKPSKTIVGSIAGGFVLIVGLSLGMVMFLRRRHAKRSGPENPQEPKEGDAAYGLLMEEGLDADERFELGRDSVEYQDDKDGSISPNPK